jgi:outer membrane protein OmpA-like peptidoglycan-associated protein
MGRFLQPGFKILALGYGIAGLLAACSVASAAVSPPANGPEDIRFGRGSVTLSNPEQLRTLAGQLSREGTYQIRGFSCTGEALEGTKSRDLAQARALRVRDQLIRWGFSPRKLYAVAYGTSNACKASLVRLE